MAPSGWRRALRGKNPQHSYTTALHEGGQAPRSLGYRQPPSGDLPAAKGRLCLHHPSGAPAGRHPSTVTASGPERSNCVRAGGPFISPSSSRPTFSPPRCWSAAQGPKDLLLFALPGIADCGVGGRLQGGCLGQRSANISFGERHVNTWAPQATQLVKLLNSAVVM